MTLAFVDTETTGLDPDRHEIWEVGLIVDEHAHHWFLPVDLGRAEPIALRIGGYHERARGRDGTGYYKGPTMDTGVTVAVDEFARRFADLTRGRHLVGAVISFDEERLRKLLRANGSCPEWHYHLVDVEALVAGKLGIEPPWDSEALSRAVGIDPESYDRHTAMGDARWAQELYDAVMRRPPELEDSGDRPE